ncbi:hypothetical protein BGZ97_000906 [Linnemannia gamsii]|uniref:F-box domain-containing protein n=1 Tax=Linnemannia gamsii TaxID=64522 RepID=A0A9P6UJK3_9FUNG|nr:hypothetical protein BGZ97_000906 [Linnemannia gamsii]
MTTSAQQRHQPSPLRILAIPELLGHIFAYIDDTTIRRTIIRVCRQWFWINKDRIVREVLWDNALPLEVLKRKMQIRIPRATHLHCSSRRIDHQDDEKSEWLLGILKWTHDEYHEHWLPLVQDRSVDSRISKTRNGVPPVEGTSSFDISWALASRPLRQLTLQGYVEIGTGIQGFLPYMASLTHLTIEQVCDSNFRMSQLLETCTRLEHLYIESLWTINLPGPWLPNRVPSHSDSKQPALPLKSLKLIHVQLPQPCLEMFLSSAPFLKELKIVLREQVVADGNDLTRLCQHLQSLSGLKLRSFHYSIEAGPPLTYDDYVMMMAVCPQSTDLTIQGSDLSFDTSRLVLDIINSNRITTLELLGGTGYVHELLCNLPHLLSVKATDSSIAHLTLDVFASFRRMAPALQPSPSPSSTYDPIRGDSIRVWACRSLQTCHLSFYADGDGQRASRVIYGYLSRVCPRLRDLKLYFPDLFLENGRVSDWNYKATMLLNLESGFCLLTRLKELERLWIDVVDMDGLLLEGYDIDWMAYSSSSSAFGSSSSSSSSPSSSSFTAASGQLSTWSQRTLNKRKRQAITAAWQPILERDQSRIAKNVARFEGMSPEEIRQKHDADLEVMLQLSSCGTLLDVKSVIDDIIDRDSRLQPQQYLFWKDLDRVAIFRGNAFGASPEVEVARLMAIGVQAKQKRNAREAAASKKDGLWSWRRLIGI